MKRFMCKILCKLPFLVAIFLIVSCSSIYKLPDYKGFDYKASDYNRSNWGSWRTKRCVNTRHMLLMRRSIKPVTLNSKGCMVKDGLWIDFYTGSKIRMSNVPQIDHVVPLKYAHSIGGHQWSKEKKSRFYNDIENLVITSRSINLKKKDKSFVNWHPVSRKLSCKYAKRWIEVKLKYKLKFNLVECLKFKNLEEAKPCPVSLPKIKACGR